MPSRRKMIRQVLSHAGMAAVGLGLTVSAAMVSESASVQAQGDATPSDAAPADALLVIPGADGQPVSLRSGPALDQPVVASLTAYEVVTPLGPAHQDGVTRWLPVKTAANQIGWVEEPYLAAVGTVSSPSPEPVVAEASPPAPALADVSPPPPPVASPAPTEASLPPAAPASESTSATTVAAVPMQPVRPLAIETKLKFPEAKDRYQEITIWVTRDGVPVPDAVVTLFIEDDEDEPTRVLEPTNVDGRTRREFSIGKEEKGSIEVVVSALAPDGGAGRTTTAYFRR